MVVHVSYQAIIKPQYVDHIPQAAKGKVLEILTAKNERNNIDKLLDEMDLRHVLVSRLRMFEHYATSCPLSLCLGTRCFSQACGCSVQSLMAYMVTA